jgi:SAM-dependent methyltransferase
VIAEAVAAAFDPQTRCWVCDGAKLEAFHRLRFDFEAYRAQDPDLAAYSGSTLSLVRCQRCGFGQPEALPTLPRFFERMYDQRWADDWVEREADARYKDLIFRTILRTLDRRAEPSGPRRLLDVGAHAGRFMVMAQQRGWTVEGIEINPKTAACAARRTGALIHRVGIDAVAAGGRRFGAVTLTDVLEHIPRPVEALTAAARVLEPGGVVAVKVPSGPGQRQKERMLTALNRSRRISLADNLVHVNHFSPVALKLALEKAGFREVTVVAGAPELQYDGAIARRFASNALRLAVYTAARIPGAIRTPLALNLQAYASTPR